ncbi:uncharacterized protein LOC115737589 [Rhodamnia argentea]|uniref:Uncharacterized protein LOC115737589 n=1 Tax=Rhodamnia argentea TaxID=178133 RepID=A0A8B8NSY0_9MYRT|nr:uncharacterized protein LOC115737589 [Rhodamnia argentea]XP_048129714.1 uncharacterized protein LOC115737589 [Rhodamnia argentea]
MRLKKGSTTMRLKKGSKVEVLSTKEDFIGAWVYSEIISGNGRNYYVKCCGSPGTGGKRVERVPRKVIRPCPPPAEGIGVWVPGDVVEVLHSLSWKTAIVVKVFHENHFLVRPVGSFRHFNVHKRYLRARQIWKDGNWFVVGKGARNCTISRRKRLVETDLKQQAGAEFSPTGGNTELQFQEDSKRKLKTGLHVCSPHVEARCVGFKKIKLITNNCHRTLPGTPSEKADASDYLNEEENNASYSFCCWRTKFPEVESGGVNNAFWRETSKNIDSYSCASSVGSSSTNGKNWFSSSIDCSIRNTSGELSDAESFVA